MLTQPCIILRGRNRECVAGLRENPNEMDKKLKTRRVRPDQSAAPSAGIYGVTLHFYGVNAAKRRRKKKIGERKRKGEVSGSIQITGRESR